MLQAKIEHNKQSQVQEKEQEQEQVFEALLKLSNIIWIEPSWEFQYAFKIQHQALICKYSRALSFYVASESSG